MHQRVRCATCHHWTDALLVWAAGDCCPRCNAPLQLGETDVEQPEDQTGRQGWHAGERPWRAPGGRFGAPGRLGERQSYR
jgi:hypothetical protein